jgi:hypothetical protein
VTDFTRPEEVVSWLGAVQAQDYSAAKWALALRTNDTTDAVVDRALDEGRILRTHILRPTWHFVAPRDIRWMLSISGPRVNAINAPYYRKLELDDKVFAKSHRAIERAIGNEGPLTRSELASVLSRAGIKASGHRLAYLMMRAELDGIICCGVRRGKQFTYALLDDRAPAAKPVCRDRALAKLATRYFTSHGPATLRDFVWWSGLTVKDARASVDAAGRALQQETIDGLTYWSAADAQRASRRKASLHLLPNYDEYLIAYRDRGSVIDGAMPSISFGGVEFPHFVVVDGKLRGTWKRTPGARCLKVTMRLYRPLARDEQRLVESEAARLGRFINQAVDLS